MDKLEQYLDRVCLSIGGPKSMRRHIRQELKEHLLDAIAERKAAGLSEEDALVRALADFGEPGEVRSELEAAHGHRLLPVVIHRAMQWKEMTMKARWLWTTMVHLFLTLVIVFELLLLSFLEAFLTPKLAKFWDDIGPVTDVDKSALAWVSWFAFLPWRIAELALWIVVPLAALWGLFEWRVRSENKTLMRLAAMSLIAIALLLVIGFSSTSTTIMWALLGPQGISQTKEDISLELVTSLDLSVGGAEDAAQLQDWELVRKHSNRALQSLDSLMRLIRNGTTRWMAQEQEAKLESARKAIELLLKAANDMDIEKARAALTESITQIRPFRDWAAAQKQWRAQQKPQRGDRK